MAVVTTESMPPPKGTSTRSGSRVRIDATTLGAARDLDVIEGQLVAIGELTEPVVYRRREKSLARRAQCRETDVHPSGCSGLVVRKSGHEIPQFGDRANARPLKRVDPLKGDNLDKLATVEFVGSAERRLFDLQADVAKEVRARGLSLHSWRLSCYGSSRDEGEAAAGALRSVAIEDLTPVGDLTTEFDAVVVYPCVKKLTSGDEPEVES